MPLLVHCPNNCQIRLPSNRMGKVIRCVDCQTPIRIPELDSPLLRTGNWVECRAKLAIKKTDQSNNACDIANETPLLSPSIESESDQPNGSATSISPTSSSDTVFPLEPPPQNARLLRAKPWRVIEPLTSVDPEANLTPIDLEIEPASAKPTKLPQPLQGSAANLESNQQPEPNVDNAGTPDWWLLIRNLIWYETPAADTPATATTPTEEPPRSV